MVQTEIAVSLKDIVFDVNKTLFVCLFPFVNDEHMGKGIVQAFFQGIQPLVVVIAFLIASARAFALAQVAFRTTLIHLCQGGLL